MEATDPFYLNKSVGTKICGVVNHVFTHSRAFALLNLHLPLSQTQNKDLTWLKNNLWVKSNPYKNQKTNCNGLRS